MHGTMSLKKKRRYTMMHRVYDTVYVKKHVFQSVSHSGDRVMKAARKGISTKVCTPTLSLVPASHFGLPCSQTAKQLGTPLKIRSRFVSNSLPLICRCFKSQTQCFRNSKSKKAVGF